MSKKVIIVLIMLTTILAIAIPTQAAHKHTYSGGNCRTNSRCSCGAYGPYGSHIYNNATCTSPKKCRICGIKSGSALNHSYIAATCSSPKRCKRCNVTSGNALGHNYTKYVSCTSRYACTRCNRPNPNGRIVGHKLSNPTCTSNAKCTRCSFSVSGSSLGHIWKAATCTSPKTCTRCGTKTGSALNHSYIAATCSSPKRCDRCNTTWGNGLGHSYTKYVSCTSRYACARCNQPDPNGKIVGHNFSDPTCTLNVKCKKCNLEVSGSSLGHGWKKATCTSAETCARCGITNGSALGHLYIEATCSSPKRCDRCNTTWGNGLGHSYTKFVACNSPYACAKCGILNPVGKTINHIYDNNTHICKICNIYEMPEEVEKSLRETNPNYKLSTSDENYTFNCQRCIVTYQQIRAGKDGITAQSYPKSSVLFGDDLAFVPFIAWNSPQVIQWGGADKFYNKINDLKNFTMKIEIDNKTYMRHPNDENCIINTDTGEIIKLSSTQDFEKINKIYVYRNDDSVGEVEFKKSTKITSGDKTSSKFLKNILNELEGTADGTLVQITAEYKNDDKTGHTFVAERINGETRFFDPQKGIEIRDTEEYFGQFLDDGSGQMWRINELSVSEIGETCFKSSN